MYRILKRTKKNGEYDYIVQRAVGSDNPAWIDYADLSSDLEAAQNLKLDLEGQVVVSEEVVE